MSVLLKRTMTLKSVIGFGSYPDLTVGQMIDTGKRYELLKMYYNLDRIDFSQEVKDILFITKEREIQKPGRNRTSQRKIFIHEIINDERAAIGIEKGSMQGRMNRVDTMAKHIVVKCHNNLQNSKISNLNRNQGR